MYNIYRRTLSLLTLLAVGILTAAIMVAVSPAMFAGGQTAQLEAGALAAPQFGTLVTGVVIGILISAVARFNWEEVPRRVVNWVLLRERQLFYVGMLLAGIAILVLY